MDKYFLVIIVVPFLIGLRTFPEKKSCSIPLILRGSWFSLEDGKPTQSFLDATTMSGRGVCEHMVKNEDDNYTLMFRNDNGSYHCMRAIPRSVNVFEKVESSFVNLQSGEEPTIERVCEGIIAEQQLITLFNENYIPINCRSSLEGVWQFAYKDRSSFTGQCDHPQARVKACQNVKEKKFEIFYKECKGISGTSRQEVEYACLGDWWVGRNHYFAVANTRESRKDDKFRCILKDQKQEQIHLGVSNTAECNTLKTAENSPIRMQLTPAEADVVLPGCRLPKNFTGNWINMDNIEVSINETHLTETYSTNQEDPEDIQRSIYICKEQKDSRMVMIRLSSGGCPNEYTCFDFLPQQHSNSIRYRKGRISDSGDFSTTCSWEKFKNTNLQWQSWDDDYLSVSKQ